MKGNVGMSLLHAPQTRINVPMDRGWGGQDRIANSCVPTHHTEDRNVKNGAMANIAVRSALAVHLAELCNVTF